MTVDTETLDDNKSNPCVFVIQLSTIKGPHTESTLYHTKILERERERGHYHILMILKDSLKI